MRLTREQLKQIKSNLVNFRYVVLSNDQENELKSPYFHYDLSDLLLKNKNHVAIEMFRESGKSSYALRTYPLYAMAYPQKNRDYIVIIKQNQRTASNKFELLDTTFTNSGTKSLSSTSESDAHGFPCSCAFYENRLNR